VPAKRIKPAGVEVTLESKVQVISSPEEAATAPGGLYPLITRAFEMDEYRLMAGWPVSVPPYDIRANTMISATGEVLGDRDDPTSVVTDALVRWVADDQFYNPTTLTWTALQDTIGHNQWTTSTDYAPVLIEDYQYRIGNEVLYRSALNFDSDARKHMWIDFSATIGGSSGYTVIMVVSPNSVYGNNEDVLYNGLWCPGRPSPGTDTFTETIDPNWMSVTMQGHYLYLETESKGRTRGISINPALSSNTPMYLAMVFDRPTTTFYVGEGPSSIRVKTMPTGTTEALPLDGGITLGRTPGDVLHTADMALFDLGIYADRLSAPEIEAEFAVLSQAYGGDS